MTSYEDLTEITGFDPLPALGRKKRGKKKTTIERTHCSRGHPLSGDNLYMRPKPNGKYKRECKECRDVHRARHTRNISTNGSVRCSTGKSVDCTQTTPK